MAGAMPSEGLVLSGRYELLAPLGRGGMGAVWRARHLALGSDCAVKLMDPSIATDVSAARRFKREAQASAALRSPHVVQILDFGVDGGTPYLVMELLEGESLGARLERVRRLGLDETSKILTEVARALGKVHESGVVHRDVKPHNVFLARVDDHEITKLLDFGIAKSAHLSAVTKTGAVVGTPQYMSPEQIENRAVDARSDLWSLALVVYECLAGRAPFSADSIGELVLQICARPLPVPSQVAPVPRGFDAWFARAAARDPADRFPSARAMAEAFATLARTSTAEAVAPTVTLPSVPPAATHWRGGDESRGYEIRSDLATRTLHLSFWGLWDVALARAFHVAVCAAYDAFGGKPFVALSDASRFIAQRPEVQEIHKSSIKIGFSRGLGRVGAIVSSALSQMQIKRMFEEAGSPPHVKFTADPAEARAWIGR